MVNKCVVVGCDYNYDKRRKRDATGNLLSISTTDSECNETASSDIQRTGIFHFPKNDELNQKWTKFVSRKGWRPTNNSVICSSHFEPKYLIRCKQKVRLNFELDPVPTIYPAGHIPQASSLPTAASNIPRKAPRNRCIPDEYADFVQKDKIKDFKSLDHNCCPNGFTFQKFDDHVVYFRLDFSKTFVPEVVETIVVDKDLHVKLFYKGSPIPLPEWFRQGHSCKLSSIGMLDNFPAYINNRASEMPQDILQEMEKIQYIKPKGRPPYSSQLIRFALMQRYTSRQSYSLLLENFPLPSFSLLKKLSQGGVDPIKSLKLLLEKGCIDADVILMIDEMYLQKSCEYSSGVFVGRDDSGDFFNGIMVFMVVSLKKSIPFVIKSCPKTKINGTWLFSQISESIETLSSSGFIVRAVVSDNHPVNVNAFSVLKKEYASNPSALFIMYPSVEKRIYVLYDSVHLLKNIRNNLLNAKRFIFPEFMYSSETFSIHVPSGEISWSLLHCVHDNDEKLSGNLRKAPKLTYSTLHPGNNKQNVQLALNIFHETTIAAVKSYFPERIDAAQFLKLVGTWWTITNSKTRYSPNFLGNAIVLGDNKAEFLRCFADWLSTWKDNSIACCEKFTLTSQTSSALTCTLNASACLTEDLLNEGYEFVIPSRLQSDPLERRFSAYRQMSGGRFLVGLREVINSEKIVLLKSLLKENICFWEENIGDLKTDEKIDHMEVIKQHVAGMENEIQEAVLSKESEEVAVYISGYIIKKLIRRFNCDDCKIRLQSNGNTIEDGYIKLLNRGGLSIPSQDACNLYIPIPKDVSCHMYMYW